MPRTRLVCIDPEFPREAADNCATIALAGPLRVTWRGFEALFRRACPDVRSICRRFPEPGVALVACHSSLGVTGAVCIAAKPGSINATIVGRHREADLFLSADAGVALRHLVVITHKLDSPSLFSVLDLRTGSGFQDEEGETREAVTCDGPLFIRCGDYALFLLPTAIGRTLAGDAATAWHELPPRRLVAAAFGTLKGPRQPLSLEGVPEPVGTFTSVSFRSGPRVARGDLLQPGEVPSGELRIDGPHGTASVTLGATALREGVLLGRYDRCDTAAVFDGTVSQVHALLVEVDDDLYAVDCASTHHLFVGGERQRVAALGASSSMRLGRTRVDWTLLH